MTTLVTALHLAALFVSWSNFVSTGNVVQILVLAATGSIVRLSIILLVEKCLDPLNELKIVLVSGLNQLSDIDVTLDSILIETLLQNLVVVNILMFCLSCPLDSTEGESAWVQAIHDATVHCSSSALLNLLNAKL